MSKAFLLIWHGQSLTLLFHTAYSIAAGHGPSQVLGNVTVGTKESRFC